jgi:excisionase family DNA binding protein
MSATKASPEFISTTKAAARLGVSPFTIRRMIEDGQLAGILVPGRRPKASSVATEQLRRESLRPARTQP